MTKELIQEISALQKELKLVLFLINMELTEENISKNKELFSSVNWETFLELVKHHRVYPLLYIKVKQINNGWIPDFIFNFLQEEYKKNTIRMLHICGEIENLAGILSKEKIRTLYLKGPLLAHDLYGDISQRTSCDIDILIEKDNLSRMDRILQENGYIKDDYILTILNDWTWRHHHIAYYLPNKGIKLEIHWRLNPGPAKEPSFNELWKRRRKSELTSSTLNILSREDLFFFLVTHGARHGWSRLRWLLDIKQIVLKALDYNKVLNILKKNQSLQMGGQALLLVTELLNHSIPNELESITFSKQSFQLSNNTLFYLKQMVNLHHDKLSIEVANFHKKYLFQLLTGKQKIIYLLSLLYPFPVDAETLPLPKFLHFLYFPLRPFLMAWRRTRKCYYREELK
ncbi:nucleotidyltransferase family protein [Neobacillus rhizosphaerae]|uniref:nucleotidyltransferase domain-containing protein n=1 Tax=Neobacillus rhizosphaerae TaxID=2880965 RepID=UPI003D2D8921